MLRKLSILGIIIGSCLSSFGQITTGSVNGKILNASNNEVFSNVNIALYSMPDSSLVTGTASQPDGTFKIEKLAFGEYMMVSKFVGYSPDVKAFTLSISSPVFNAGDITLNESAQELEGVEIVTAKPEVMYQEGKKVLNVDQYKNSGATNLVEVLENAPSITTDTEGNVLLRGSSNYVLLIDGKPAPMTGTNLLRQIPPEMVETIEIMTNPSAKYEAEGDAGIINLVLKKQSQAGFNSMLTLMAGWNNKYNGDLQFNYRKNKVNIFGGISGSSYQTDVPGDLNRKSKVEGKDYEYNTYLSQATKLNTIAGNLGADYDLNDKNNFSISSNLGRLDIGVDVTNKIFRGFTEDGVDEQLFSTNNIALEGFFVNPKVGWIHKFDQEGHQLDVNIFAGGFNGELTQSRDEYLTDNNWNSIQDEWVRKISIENNRIRDIRLKLDYVKPLNASKLELGTQISGYNEENEFIMDVFDFDKNDWVRSDIYTNDAVLRRDIYAGYGIWSGPLKTFNYSLGLRAEYTDRLISQLTTNEEFGYTNMGLFPSGSLSKTLKGGQQLQFSFSRRINRPNRQFLNPFPQFVDNQTVRTGNPELKPEFTNSFELNFQQPVKTGMFSVETYYRQSRDLMSQDFKTDGQGNLFLLFVNANRSHSAGTELMGNLQLVKWFRLVATGNIYYYQLVDERMDEAESSRMVWSSRVNTMFQFGPNSRLTFSGVYNGPTILLNGKMAGTFMLNAGYTQTFLKRAASLTLGVRDMLSTYRIKMETFSDGLETFLDLKPESPVITLTFTYNFNNYQRRAPEEESMDLNFIR